MNLLGKKLKKLHFKGTVKMLCQFFMNKMVSISTKKKVSKNKQMQENMCQMYIKMLKHQTNVCSYFHVDSTLFQAYCKQNIELKLEKPKHTD